MPIYSKVKQVAGKAGTGDSFDEIGEVQLPDEVQYLLGCHGNFTHDTGIAAEAVHPQYRLTSDSIKAPVHIFSGDGFGGGPATNVGFYTARPVFCEYYAQGEQVGGARIKAEVSTHLPDPTNTSHVGFDAVSCDFVPTRELRQMLMMRGHGFLPSSSPGPSCADSEGASANTGTGGVAVGTLYVPGGYTALGFGITTVPDAFEAEEAFIDLSVSSSRITGMTPYEFLSEGWHAPLGTVVGKGVKGVQYCIPADVFCKNQGDFNMTVYSRVAQATGSLAHSVDVRGTQIGR